MKLCGEIMAVAGDKQLIISVEVDVSALRDYCRQFPALTDIRPEFLGATQE